MAERRYDVAWLSFWSLAAQYAPHVRRCSPGTLVVCDTVDVHFVRELRQAELAGDDEARRRAERLRELELQVYRQSDLVVTVTAEDAETLARAGVRTRTAVVPNVHDVAPPGPGFDARSGLVFVGNFAHAPNVDAAAWLAREIMPRVTKLLPGARLLIAGANPTPEVTALAGPGVNVVGWVPHTAPLLARARVSVAPLRFGAGMKGKVGEALAHGLPVVTTSIGAEGMALVHGQHVLIADDRRGAGRPRGR
jgi:glycosyltransferase involved in cell wall biosynthesis